MAACGAGDGVRTSAQATSTVSRVCAAVPPATSILAGMRPGIVSALIELDADVDGILAAYNLDDAFSQIEAQK